MSYPDLIGVSTRSLPTCAYPLKIQAFFIGTNHFKPFSPPWNSLKAHYISDMIICQPRSRPSPNGTGSHLKATCLERGQYLFIGYIKHKTTDRARHCKDPANGGGRSNPIFRSTFFGCPVLRHAGLDPASTSTHWHSRLRGNAT